MPSDQESVSGLKFRMKVSGPLRKVEGLGGIDEEFWSKTNHRLEIQRNLTCSLYRLQEGKSLSLLLRSKPLQAHGRSGHKSYPQTQTQK